MRVFRGKETFWMGLPMAFVVLFAASVAAAQDLVARLGNLSLEESTIVITVLAGLLTGPLAALAKARWGFEGVTQERVVWAISLLVVVGTGLATGQYGHGWNGVVYAFLALLVAVGKAKGDWAKQKQTQASVIRNLARESASAAFVSLDPPTSRGGLRVEDLERNDRA